MHQLPWQVSLVAFTACASCCALCVTLSARLGSVTGIWASGEVVAGLGLTLVLSFVISLDMQDLVSQWGRVKGCRVLVWAERAQILWIQSEWCTSSVFGSTVFYLWWFHSCIFMATMRNFSFLPPPDSFKNNIDCLHFCWDTNSGYLTFPLIKRFWWTAKRMGMWCHS